MILILTVSVQNSCKQSRFKNIRKRVLQIFCEKGNIQHVHKTLQGNLKLAENLVFAELTCFNFSSYYSDVEVYSRAVRKCWCLYEFH